MSTASMISMIGILGFIMGGFVYFLIVAMGKEAKK